MVGIAGFGYGMSNPAAAKGLLIWFDQKTRGTVFGIRQSSVTLGGAIASVFLVYVCQKVGAINALLILGLMIALMFIVACFFYHTRGMEKKFETNAQGGNNKSPESGLGGIFTDKVLINLYIIGAVLGLAQGIIASFFLIYVHEGLKFSVAKAGSLLSVLMISGTVGRVFWGLISDRLLGGKRKPILLVISSLLTISVAVLAFWSAAWQKSLFFFVASVIGLSSVGWPGLLTLMLAEASVPSKAASSVGLGTTIGWAGMFIGPLVFGALTDNFGYFYAWICLVGFSLISLILCFLLPAHTPYSSPVMRQT
jgi:sugar phosphate permease